jgi:hypothetical protein
MTKKLTRRNFLKIFGAAGAIAAAGAAGILPLDVDMSKGMNREAKAEAVEEAKVQEKEGHGHPCTDKVERDAECDICNYYFCPHPEFRRNSTYFWNGGIPVRPLSTSVLAAWKVPTDNLEQES